VLDISFGLKPEAQSVIRAVEQTLQQGFRTDDIASAAPQHEKLLNTVQMGNQVVKEIDRIMTSKSITV